MRSLAALAFVAGLSLAPAHAREAAGEVRTSSFSGAFLAARSAEIDNDLDSAITYYQQALAFDASDLSVRQSLMLALIAQGRFDEALVHAEALKDVAEVERYSRLALAIDSFRDNDYGAARDWLMLSLASDLDRLISRLLTAWTEQGDGDPEAAFTTLDGLQGPEWYVLFVSYHRALIAEAAGLDDVAEAAYEATVVNESSGSASPDTYLRASEAYAGFLARRDRAEEALAVLDRAEMLAPGRLPIAAARERIEAGETLGPLVAGTVDGASEVLLNLGAALNRGGGEAFVRLYLQFAHALKPESDMVLLHLGAVAEMQSRPEEAIVFYGRIPADSPLKRASEMQLGLNLADLERHEEAVEHLAALLDDDPDDMRAYLALGGVHAVTENYRAAADVYDRAVARIEEPQTSDWNIFYHRGIAYERLKEWPKAEPNFRKSLELFPDQPQVLNYLGYSWVDMNMNLEEGLEMIQRAVELRPSDGYIVDSLGWAYYRLGRFEDAVRELERAVSLRPEDPILNDHLGDAYWRVGRRLEATFQWRHALDRDPEPDLRADVEQKLAEGLPPPGERAAVEAVPASAEQDPAVVPIPADGRTEAPEPEETVAEAPARYMVRPGQSLWSIAAETLGDGNRFPEILDLNPALQGDPARLRPGQELAIPGPAN